MAYDGDPQDWGSGSPYGKPHYLTVYFADGRDWSTEFQLQPDGYYLMDMIYPWDGRITYDRLFDTKGQILTMRVYDPMMPVERGEARRVVLYWSQYGAHGYNDDYVNKTYYPKDGVIRRRSIWNNDDNQDNTEE